MCHLAYITYLKWSMFLLLSLMGKKKTVWMSKQGKTSRVFHQRTTTKFCVQYHFKKASFVISSVKHDILKKSLETLIWLHFFPCTVLNHVMGGLLVKVLKGWLIIQCVQSQREQPCFIINYHFQGIYSSSSKIKSLKRGFIFFYIIIVNQYSPQQTEHNVLRITFMWVTHLRMMLILHHYWLEHTGNDSAWIS